MTQFTEFQRLDNYDLVKQVNDFCREKDREYFNFEPFWLWDGKLLRGCILRFDVVIEPETVIKNTLEAVPAGWLNNHGNLSVNK